MKVKQTLCIAAAIASIALAGCGKSNAPAPAGAKKVALKANDGLPDPDCPGRIDSALPGPDIAGLKLGAPRDAALNFARCLNPSATVSFEAIWLQGLRTFGIKLAPQAFTTRLGENRPCKYNGIEEMQRCGADNRVWTHVAEAVTVASPGTPGHEKVMGIWREQHFVAGAMPALEAVLRALLQKYGAPQGKQATPNQWIRLDWIQDPSGAALTPDNRTFAVCRGISPRARDGQSWNAACGLTLTAMIVVDPQNPQLVEELSIGLVNQQALYNLGQSLQAELQALDRNRQQQEVEKARGAGANVKL